MNLTIPWFYSSRVCLVKKKMFFFECIWAIVANFWWLAPSWLRLGLAVTSTMGFWRCASLRHQKRWQWSTSTNSLPNRLCTSSTCLLTKITSLSGKKWETLMEQSKFVQRAILMFFIWLFFRWIRLFFTTRTVYWWWRLTATVLQLSSNVQNFT